MDDCMICGTEMENFEGVDSEYFLGNHCEKIVAYCPHCKKWYSWWEIFTFSHVEEFKVEEGR